MKKTNLTKVELARTLSITRKTLDRYLAMDGAPKSTANGWNVEAVVKFIEENASRSETGEVGGDLKALRAREIGLRCEKLRLQIDTEKKRYVLADDVRSWLIQAIEKQKYILGLKLKNELPPKLEGLRAAEIAAKMEPLIVEICEQMRTALSTP